MYISRVHHPPTKRPRGPRMHIHPTTNITTLPDRTEHTQRVPRRVRERRVAVHGAESEQP